MMEMTREQEQTVCQMMSSCWDYIGADCLRCLGSRNYMRRSEVIEAVLDAGSIELLIMKAPEEVEAMRIFRKLDYRKQQALGRRAFQCKTYGW